MDSLPPLAAWGLDGSSAEELTGGSRNTVLRIGDVVLKTTRRSEAALRWLLPVQEAARRAGLLVPRSLESTSGTLSADGWTCEERLDGTAPVAVPPSLCPMIKHVHDATYGIAQRPGFASVTDMPAQGLHGDVDMDAIPAQIAATLRRVWADMPVGRECAIHADIYPENLLIVPDGRLALIDWDEARRDRPVFDLAAFEEHRPAASLAWEVACSWTLEPDYAQRMLARLLSSFPEYA